MFSVALIGPDGSGKTTVCQRLVADFPLPITYLYMGVSSDSSNRMLPTTRLVRTIKRAFGGQPDNRGPRDPKSVSNKSGNPIKRALKSAKSLVGLTNKLAEESYRQVLAWHHSRRGRIVLFDRHYFSDYYAYDVAPTDEKRPLARRIHGYFLNSVYPKPDLVIFLDAPAEVLFARKGEGTVELLEKRRQDYLQIRGLVPRFAVVDAAQPADAVVRDVQERMLEFHRSLTEDAVRMEAP